MKCSSRRIRKVDSDAPETTLYYYNDNWQVLQEYNGAGTTAQRYFVYGNYIDEVLIMNDGTDYYYAHNHLYSPVALMENDGDVIERYEYDAYGRATVFTVMGDWDTGSPTTQAYSDYGNPYMFTGRRLDTLDDGDYDIMYYRNRYYDTETGRFLTHDPLGNNAQRSVSFYYILVFLNAQLRENIHILSRLDSQHPLQMLFEEVDKFYTETSPLVRPELFKIYEMNFSAKLISFGIKLGEIGVYENNLYSYAKSSPLNTIDPYGLYWGEGIIDWIRGWFPLTPGVGPGIAACEAAPDILDGLNSINRRNRQVDDLFPDEFGPGEKSYFPRFPGRLP